MSEHAEGELALVQLSGSSYRVVDVSRPCGFGGRVPVAGRRNPATGTRIARADTISKSGIDFRESVLAAKVQAPTAAMVLDQGSATALSQAAAAADRTASSARFAEYRRLLAPHTRCAHDQDLTRCVLYLADVGVAVGTLAEDPAAWAGFTWNLVEGFKRWMLREGYAPATLNRIRFTPRKPDSTWSAVNVARVAVLTAEGRIRPAGMRAFDARRPERTAVYSYEQRHEATFDAASEAQFRANVSAWAFFTARPPSYRQAAIRWVMSAKQAETRQRRLETMISDSAVGRTIKELTPPSKRRSGTEPSDGESLG